MANETRRSGPGKAWLAAYSVVFALVHQAANQLGWYYAYGGTDVLMHVGGGVWVAWAAWEYRDLVRGYAGLPRWAQAAGILAFVALVGVLWELLELGADVLRVRAAGASWSHVPRAMGLPPYDVRWDTLMDLVNDLVGGALVGIIAMLQSGGGRASRKG